jgi:hypothetical protein
MKTKIRITFFKWSSLIIFPLLMQCTPPSDSLKPLTPIPANDVIQLIKEYKTKRSDVINAHFDSLNSYGEGFSDSRFITFDADTLENFIRQIKLKIENNHLDIKLGGVRCFYTVYPDILQGPYLGRVNPSYKNHHAILMVPTFINAAGDHQEFDFDQFEDVGGLRKPKDLKLLFSGDNKDQNPATSFYFLNMGGLCPPPFADSCKSTLLGVADGQ